MFPLMLNNRFARVGRRMAFEFMFHQLAGVADLTPAIAKARHETECFRNVKYRTTGREAHMLDIYRPKHMPGPYPVMIYIHGGGFTMGSKDTHRACGYLYARMGYLVFNINYRLAPRYRYPAAFQDVAKAYGWVTEKAAAYGGDIHRLTLAGESAGANLVLALTLSACLKRTENPARIVWETGIRPSAVQVICGLLQVSNPERFRQGSYAGHRIMDGLSIDIARDVSAAYLGKAYQRHTDDKAMADPLVLLEATTTPDHPYPPMFVAAGTGDLVCSDSERLERALVSNSQPVEAHYYPGEPHAFHFMYWRPAARQYWRDSRAFLDKYIEQPRPKKYKRGKAEKRI